MTVSVSRGAICSEECSKRRIKNVASRKTMSEVMMLLHLR